MTTPAHPGPSRYSTRAFPDYRYIPGQSPHPTRDPEGHSFSQHPMQELAPFDATRWQSCDEYLYGIDLFNHGYWWEAHEAFEPVWTAAGKQTETGLFLQGLIQIAVASLKNLQGQTEVGKRMARSGIDKIRRREGIYLGIDVARLCREVKRFFENVDPPPVIIELTMDNQETTGIANRLLSLFSKTKK